MCAAQMSTEKPQQEARLQTAAQSDRQRTHRRRDGDDAKQRATSGRRVHAHETRGNDAAEPHRTSPPERRRRRWAPFDSAAFRRAAQARRLLSRCSTVSASELRRRLSHLPLLLSLPQSSPPLSRMSSSAHSLSFSAGATPIVIVGAGCVGLAVGLQLLQAGHKDVVIIARETTPHTTSDQAGQGCRHAVRGELRRCEQLHSADQHSLTQSLSLCFFLCSGALWRPFGEVSPSNATLFREWGASTFQFLNRLRLEHGSNATGILLVSGFEVFPSAAKAQKPFWAGDVLNFREVDEAELKTLGMKGQKAGWSYTSFVVEMNKYMAFLHRSAEERSRRLSARLAASLRSGSRSHVPLSSLCVSSEFFRLGGRLHLTTLPSLSAVHSLVQNVSLIINCSGLGAGALVGDAGVFPVAGHILRMSVPALQHFYMDSENTTYIFPRSTDVIVGGTYLKHDASTQPSIQNRIDILSRASGLAPEIAEASSVVLGEYVGLRPYREVTRLELELPSAHPRAAAIAAKARRAVDAITAAASSSSSDAHAHAAAPAPAPLDPLVRCPVIHNYGHGGSGVTLHWGCGETVLQIMSEQIGMKPSGPRKIATSKL